MTKWTLEEARNQLSEVVRRALDHKPQLITRGGRDSVVVVAKSDYERLVAPEGLVPFMRRSPLADAIRRGELREDAFDRARDLGRDVDIR